MTLDLSYYWARGQGNQCEDDKCNRKKKNGDHPKQGKTNKQTASYRIIRNNGYFQIPV